jgi:hypothetical protein
MSPILLAGQTPRYAKQAAAMQLYQTGEPARRKAGISLLARKTGIPSHSLLTEACAVFAQSRLQRIA